MADALTELRQLMEIGGLPDLRPGPREGVLPLAKLEAQLNPLLEKTRLPKRELIRGLILLWHDHEEPAHAIAQDDPTTNGSLLHGILHRREPDYGNAAYWFRRVGNHPCFTAIAKQVGQLLESNGKTELQRNLLPSGKWDPFAFINACEAAGGDDKSANLLRQIQGIELNALLNYFVST